MDVAWRGMGNACCAQPQTPSDDIIHRESSHTGKLDEGAELCKACQAHEQKHVAAFRGVECRDCKRIFSTHCRAASNAAGGPQRCRECAMKMDKCSACDRSLQTAA